MQLEGKVAVVTGGGSGIGLATIQLLGRNKIKVAIVGRTQKKLQEAQDLVEREGGEAHIFPTDITKPDEVRQMAEQVYNHFGRIDILINNAGLGIFRNVEDLEISEWHNMVDVILNGTFYCTHYLLPYIYKNDRGHVIIISSLWAKDNCATCAGYVAAKHGQKGFAESLREEARKHNVKVSNIMPGTVDSPFFEKCDWDVDTSRALKVEDVAGLILYALQTSDHSAVEDVVMQAVNRVFPTI